MKITEVFIKRPVFASMVIMAFFVLGLFAYQRLPIDLFPQVDFPVVIVTTNLLGASPEEVETEITKKIEEQINTISGLDELQSFSFDGRSQVIATFVLEKSGDVAAEEVRDRVNRVVSEFPFGTKAPIVQKFDMAATPILQVVVTGSMPIRDLSYFTRKRVKEMIETVDGVGDITIVGAREREIHVVIDPIKLSARKLSIFDLETALKKQNIELPGGRITEEPRELTLRTMGKIEKAEDFANIPITTINGTTIFIRDVAFVKDVEAERRSFSRYDGTPCINLIIKKQSGANTVDTANRLNARIEEIKKILPSGMNIHATQDQSRFIMASVHSLQEDVILGALLVSLTVLIFLRNFRSMIICAVSIPISLVSTFALIKWAGFTLNNLTLLALSLATGIVIDDAIIVLENIFRHVEEKNESPMRAASIAIGEIGLAVISTTLSLMIIFLPLAFMSGIVGRFMHSFGLTMAFAIGISLIVAFVLTPTMSARMLKIKDTSHKLTSRESKINKFFDTHYTRMLTWVLAHRKISFIAAILIMMSSVPSIILVGKDFVPKDDRSEFNIHIKAPVGTSIKEMDKITQIIETELKKVRGVTNLLTSIGGGSNQAVNEGDIYVQLLDINERSYSQKEVMGDVRNLLSRYKSLRTSVQDIGGAGGGSEAGFQVRVIGSDLDKLRDYSNTIMEKMRERKGFVDVDTSFEFGKPEVRVHLDRSQASDLGATAEDVAGALQLYISGDKDITKFKVADELYNVRMKVDDFYRSKPSHLLGLLVPTSIGNGREKSPVRLDQIANVEETSGPSHIERYARQRSIQIGANLVNLPTGTAKQYVIDEVEKMGMEPGYSIDFVGQAKFMQQMQTNFIMAFALSFIFMYIILASLFESLLHPVTILASLPLAFPFALLSLAVTGMTLHIISILGLFLLIGIVKKNSILQVDYTNTLREQGMPRDIALIEASRTRLRPILMTTLTLVAGMIPVALSSGPGSAGRAPMAVVIIGGQSLCLLVTLLLTPVFYSIFDDAQTKWLPDLFQKTRNLFKS